MKTGISRGMGRFKPKTPAWEGNPWMFSGTKQFVEKDL